MGLGLGCRWWCMYIFSGWDGRRELPRARVCVWRRRNLELGRTGPVGFGTYIYACANCISIVKQQQQTEAARTSKRRVG